jgi:DNA-binding winged helix-turn-helix (wHTH) protein/TolB-like protein
MDSREYRFGRFTLTPFRQLTEDGRPVAIGKKALEILSVLAKAEGRLVTKDELMAAVWRAVIVEDNALQVHVASLRKVMGADAELLVTVHGMGYRLAASSAAPSLDTPPSPPRKAPLRCRVPAALLAVSLIVLATMGWWLMRDRPAPASKPGEMKVAVLPFDATGAPARAFAASLEEEMASELSDSQIQVISRSGNALLLGADSSAAIARLGVGLVLDGTVTGDGNQMDVRIHLDDTKEHVTVWFAEFKGAPGAALAANAATGAADAIFWGKVGRTGKTRLDAAGLAAFIAGRESTTSVRHTETSAAAYYRKVIDAAPDFSWGHSGLASADAFQALAQAGKDALYQEAKGEAKRALQLDPHNGEAYLALEMVAPPLDWAAREKLMLAGAAAEPGFEPGEMMEGRLLWNTGRGRESLVWLKRGHDSNPLHNGETYSLAIALASEGLPVASRALLAGMQEHWPDQPFTRDARFWVNMINNAPDEVLDVLADPKGRPALMDDTAAAAWQAGLEASRVRDAKGRGAAIKTVTDAAHSGSLSHGDALLLLTLLGDLDSAFTQADLYAPIVSAYPPAYLFLPQTAPLRADPRFMKVANRLGFVAYWRTTGQWPDFCSTPNLPYDCRAEAAKLSGPVHAAR